jgi:hypothetical protein
LKSLLIDKITQLGILVKASQFVQLEKGVVVRIEGVLSEELHIMILQLLEGPHRNHELIGLLNCFVILAGLLIDFVFELVGLGLTLFRDTEILVLRTTREIEIQKIQLPGKNKVQHCAQDKVHNREFDDPREGEYSSASFQRIL